MAGRIQGITVEIGGDTTKLQTALKGVNTEIRNTQSQLRDVDKLLKLDPGNTELLAQKHRLLGDAVKEIKEKLETLKTAAEQAEQALKDGTITQDQYDGLQREIVETEQKLKALEEQARQSGATGSDPEALRDKAREMGEKTKFSASEAAKAMNYMAMAGWKTEDMLSGIEGVMNLAAASGEDLATTSDIVTDALTAFGLTAKDSGHFADILAAASSNANTNVSMMGETFKYCAPIAGALGFSAEDTTEAIGLMANAGIKGSQAGTALRTIMNNLSGEVKICGSSIGEVTVATTNADGSMRELSDIFTTVVNAINTFLTTAWNTIKNTVTTVWNAIKTFFITVWNGIKSIITTVVTAISTFLSTAWNGIKTAITTVLKAIKTAVTTVWNGIKNTITTIVNGIKNICGNIYGAVKSGFDKAINFVKNLASRAFQWGPDFIGGIVNGIKSMIGKVGDAVSSVADKIRSFLHFSVPDEGPLTDYESWMPDFIGGLAKGIEKSRGMIENAMNGMTSDLTITPRVMAAQGGYSGSAASSVDLISGINTALNTALAGGGAAGDIVIPVYIGGDMIDEIVVTAQQRMNLRSGGR